MLTYARKTGGGKYYFFCVLLNLIYALATTAPAITTYVCFVGLFTAPTDMDKLTGIIISAVFGVIWLFANIYLFIKFRAKSTVNFFIYTLMSILSVAIVYFAIWFIFIKY